MHRAAFLSIVVALGAAAAGGAAACSSTSSGSGNNQGGGDDGGGGEAGAAMFSPALPCTDSIDSIYADPGDVSGLAKGAIIKCAHDSDLSAADLLAQAANGPDGGLPAYAGKPFTSGAHVYRLLYRTERGDANSSPGYSSALALIPDTPRSGPSTPLPLVVAAHGSRGQAGRCAPSRNDLAASDVEPDFQHLVNPVVGFGFPVIAPDLAGYANYGSANNPPSAYDNVQDVGKSNLDGARALRQLIPSGVTQQVVLIGHSQGGYTALDTLAESNDYPIDGTIAAVAVYTPLWFSQRAWGAVLLEPQNYSFDQSSAGTVSLWYHYTNGELLDGPGHGLDLIQPSKAAVVKAFVDNDCWSTAYPDLLDAGSSANDFFLPSYVSTISKAATPLGNGDCKGDATCQKWIDRMTSGWPHITGDAAKVPILVWYANDDVTITPDGMQCAFNRLSADGTNYQHCYDPNPVGHAGPPAVDNNYVVDWIAHETLGEPAPQENCQQLALNDAGVPQLVDDAGKPIPCNSLLPQQ